MRRWLPVIPLVLALCGSLGACEDKGTKSDPPEPPVDVDPAKEPGSDPGGKGKASSKEADAGASSDAAPPASASGGDAGQAAAAPEPVADLSASAEVQRACCDWAGGTFAAAGCAGGKPGWAQACVMGGGSKEKPSPEVCCDACGGRAVANRCEASGAADKCFLACLKSIGVR